MYVLTARICFNMSSLREKKSSFENVLVEEGESLAGNKKLIGRRIVIIFNLNVHLHRFVSFIFKLHFE